ncbi:MAG: glutamate-5-semialdehyde dehydrogenase [Ruminococcaceae bacterium]|nr:glutamate-5-semialdehyde dehydrogenase [Oscillospiraceae bacterium]
MQSLIQMAEKAKKASYELACIDSAKKDDVLKSIADELVKNADYIISQNEIDLKNAREKGISESMLDRLTLTKARIDGIAEGVMQVRALADPVGEVLGMQKRPNGLVIGKKRVPLGVIGIIYEARPNVTVDAAVLCLKSSNAAILRGGSEAINSNKALAKIMRNALLSCGLNEDCVCLIEDTSRETATQMMKLNGYIDVLIPRGGAGLIRSVVENATVPVIETGTGNCHIYAHSECDFDMARDIIINAKTSRPAVCNAAESLVIDKKIAPEFLPMIYDALKEKGVEVRGCERSCEICPDMKRATDEDFYTEYTDYIISVKIVDDIDEAIEHINTHNTKHSEAIVTNNYAASQKFLDKIDAAAVYVNASTRFTDGYEFGLGAEIGISTQKIHARGPMGLSELTTIKYIVYGNGQIR